MRKRTNTKENAISAGPHLQKWHYSLAHTLPLALGSARSSPFVNASTFGGTLFAEADLGTLAFFLQVLRWQEQGEHELSYSGHVCAWLVFVRKSHPKCTSDEGHQTITECIRLQTLYTTLCKHHGAYSEIRLCVASTLQSPKAPSQHPFQKAPAVPPAPGPGLMELFNKSRESAVRAFSWPTAEAKEAAPPSPHSGAAAWLPVLSGREEERTVGAETLIRSPCTPCVRTAKGPSED